MQSNNNSHLIPFPLLPNIHAVNCWLLPAIQSSMDGVIGCLLQNILKASTLVATMDTAHPYVQVVLKYQANQQ